MATEPTLGVRILAGAVGLSLAWNRATVDRSMAKLRALAARADAAERGMVAFAKEVTAGNMHTLVDERREALAAWRAITEGVQP